MFRHLFVVVAFASTILIGAVAFVVSSAGAGTGIDADFLDGLDSTEFALESAGVRNSAAQNTAAGSGALISNTTGGKNTSFGFDALNQNTSGNWNTAVGRRALANNTGGQENTATGAVALEENTTGHENTAIGFHAMQMNTNGSTNTAVGRMHFRAIVRAGSPGLVSIRY